MEVLRKYGEAATIVFPLVDRGTLDFESTPVTFAAGDVKIIKNEGAAANTTNLPAHEGNGIYSLALTATEMQAARIAITLIDTATKTWEDQAIILSTYGNASGQHEFDLDAAALTASDILTTQMTEAYAADGVAPTLAQALFMIQQFQQEKSVASTTLTVKKLDGSTSAMTFTLDDATDPTSITRAS